VGFAFLAVNAAMHLQYQLSYFKRLIITVVLLLVSNALLYEAFAFIGASPSVQAIGVMYGIIGIIISARPITFNKLPVMDRADLVCLAVALAIVGALLFPVVHNASPAETYSQATLHLLSSGEDNASHYALFKYGYKHDGYAYRENKDKSGLISTLVVYPQGSEFTMSWVAKSVLGAGYADNDGVLIKAYYLLCSLNFSLLVLIILMFATTMYSKMRGRLDIVSHVIVLTVGGVALFVGPLLEVMGRGFHSQIFAYICLASVLFILSMNDKRVSQKQELLILALFTAGVCIGWWYLLPVLALPLLLYAVENRVPIKRYVWWPLPVVYLAAVYPIVLSLRASIGANALTAEGGVDVVAVSTIGIYIIGALTIFLWKKQREAKTKYLVSALCGWLLFTAMVAVIQLHATQHLQYYYYKSLFTVIPLATIIILISSFRLAIFLLRGATAKRRSYAALAGVLLTGILLLTLRPVYPQVYLHDWYNNPTSPSVFGQMLEIAKDTNTKDIILVGGCNPGEMYIYNRWAGAIMLSENHARSQFENALLRGQHAKVANYINKSMSSEKTRLIVISKCLQDDVKAAIPGKSQTMYL
jgi:hypothetical protein